PLTYTAESSQDGEKRPLGPYSIARVWLIRGFTNLRFELPLPAAGPAPVVGAPNQNAIGAGMEILKADRPITHRRADTLDYWPFAQSLAKGLVGRAPRDGFVVGIQARWGMGKTSAINLLLQAISENEEGPSCPPENENSEIQSLAVRWPRIISER